jgi:hypothetical protein
MEAKLDPDSGSLRIAIGQFLDYQRFLPHQAGIDLAILTITRPPKEYMEFLQFKVGSYVRIFNFRHSNRSGLHISAP